MARAATRRAPGSPNSCRFRKSQVRGKHAIPGLNPTLAVNLNSLPLKTPSPGEVFISCRHIAHVTPNKLGKVLCVFLRGKDREPPQKNIKRGWWTGEPQAIATNSWRSLRPFGPVPFVGWLPAPLSGTSMCLSPLEKNKTVSSNSRSPLKPTGPK